MVLVPSQASVSPGLYCVLLLIIVVATGTHLGEFLIPGMHPADSITGGCLKDFAEFWEFDLLPNSYLSLQDQAQALQEVTRASSGGITHGVMRILL